MLLFFVSKICVLVCCLKSYLRRYHDERDPCHVTLPHNAFQSSNMGRRLPPFPCVSLFSTPYKRSRLKSRIAMDEDGVVDQSNSCSGAGNFPWSASWWERPASQQIVIVYRIFRTCRRSKLHMSYPRKTNTFKICRYLIRHISHPHSTGMIASTSPPKVTHLRRIIFMTLSRWCTALFGPNQQVLSSRKLTVASCKQRGAKCLHKLQRNTQ